MNKKVKIFSETSGCEENKIKCFTDYPVICLSNKDNAVLKLYIYIYIYILLHLNVCFYYYFIMPGFQILNK